ncbi:MAG: MBL fold metallo-hydrolase [Pseudomonadota bacterium]
MKNTLPSGVTVLERGWLSSNNVLCTGRDATAVVDSGYFLHQQQTVALVQQALGVRTLDLLVNTHLHSDHCGGNAALQQNYPDLHTAIPPGQALLVADWDPVALSYTPTGQHCPRFSFDSTLVPGSSVALGDQIWQVFCAPGHDPNAVVLFEPISRTLISGDALWQNGFGVIFPELEGESGFAEVAATLDLIETLEPQIVIPGHGPMFSEIQDAIALARKRLDGFVRDPRKHALHAGKVLVKFKLLEVQRMAEAELLTWARATHYFTNVHHRYFSETQDAAWIASLVDDLVRSGAARRTGNDVLNA